MVLELGDSVEEENIFPHSKDFDQGLGKVRIGQHYLTVALDGSGDCATIAEALKILPSTGGSIYVKPGIYNITATMTISKSNVLIEGAGQSTVVKKAASMGASALFSATSLSRIIFKGIYFQAASTVVGSPSISFSGVTESVVSECYFGADGIGIKFASACARNKIFNNWFVSCDQAINFAAAVENVIHSNSFDGTPETAITFDSTSNRNVLKDNFHNGGGTSLNFIQLHGDNNIVANNLLYNLDILDVAVVINATADRTILLGNTFLTTGGYSNSGTNTEIGHNTVS